MKERPRLLARYSLLVGEETAAAIVDAVGSILHGHIRRLPWWLPNEARILRCEGGEHGLLVLLGDEVVLRLREGIAFKEATNQARDDVRLRLRREYSLEYQANGNASIQHLNETIRGWESEVRGMSTSSEYPAQSAWELCLPHLSPQQEQIVRLIAEGYSAREAGRSLGIRKATVFSQLQRARVKLREAGVTAALVGT